MYKVFVNDRPIIFTSSLKNEEDLPLLKIKNIVISRVINQVKTGKLKGVYLFSNTLEGDWLAFCKKYNMIKAGGGLVSNDENELLFIYRAKKWDLPKGRIDGDEDIQDTALREVKEECGIQNLEIKQFLLNTYHFYYDNRKLRLKKIYWYLMHTDHKGKLNPLLEEGIKKAEFKKSDAVAKALKKTYANVRTVFAKYNDLNIEN
ncbi:NUDIX domain-containing protein [uncultured Tenacibaculum sp.]|uniref:NUDIX hydrolase n=1 Tax=uncultured Tenacibaculum sp. TaxID=174713 RepID=UPI00261908F0|nr:NUDIX domain-containing protein [uncultured Tenacibaculum sp.]